MNFSGCEGGGHRTVRSTWRDQAAGLNRASEATVTRMPARPKQRAAARVPACPAMVSRTGGRASAARTGLSRASATRRGSIACGVKSGDRYAAPQRRGDVPGDGGSGVPGARDESEERPEAERGGLSDEVEAAHGRLE